MSSILDALGYVGDTLSKPGRAVRGVIGGRMDEGLSFLPFSDSLGLTDPSRAVTGHDLLGQMGFEPGDGLGGTLAGIGVDVATDPLTYFGGALTRGLLRGGSRGVSALEEAGPESHIFDLVTPEERAALDVLPQTIDNVAPVQAQAEAAASPLLSSLVGPAPEVAQVDDASALLNSLGDITTHPAFGEVESMRWRPDKVSDMGQPSEWGFDLGIGPENVYDPGRFGVGADMIASDNLKSDAMQHALRSWDTALGNLSDLPDNERRLLQHMTDVTSDPSTVQNFMAGANDWQGVLGERLGDVRGMIQIGSAMPEWEAIHAPFYKQYDTLRELLGPAGRYSTSRVGRTADAIGRGEVQPSGIRELLGMGRSPRQLADLNPYPISQPGTLAHLPFDEAMLRRLAAQNQIARMEYQVAELNGLAPHVNREMHLGSMIGPDMEPNIKRAVLARPDIQEQIAAANRTYIPRDPYAGPGHHYDLGDIPELQWEEALMGPVPDGMDALELDDLLRQLPPPGQAGPLPRFPEAGSYLD